MTDQRDDTREDERLLKRTAEIETRIDRGVAGDIVVSQFAGGVDIRRLGEMMEAAKLMAVSGSMVPAFLRGNPGACFGICWKAVAWGLDAYAVASQAYEVENGRTKEKTVAYMSQLIHAVIEARAPLKHRLAARYEGEGDDRVCIVSGIFRGEDAPREWRSPRLGDRRPKVQQRTNRQTGETYEVTSGSPEWQTKPDKQLFFDTSRDWARVYCPDVLLGLYSKDEMEDHGFVSVGGHRTAQDDAGLTTRLTQSALERHGFAPETNLSLTHVEQEVAGAMAARGGEPGLANVQTSEVMPGQEEGQARSRRRRTPASTTSETEGGAT